MAIDYIAVKMLRPPRRTALHHNLVGGKLAPITEVTPLT